MSLSAALILATLSLSPTAVAPPVGFASLVSDTLVTFRWIGDREQGAAIRAASTPFESFEIDVPPGFRVQNWWYGEGLLTGLHYPDGTSIALHFGGLMHLPDGDRPGAKEIPSPTGRGRAFSGVAEGQVWESHIRAYGFASVWFEGAPPGRADLLRRALATVTHSQRAR
jgi:hypothetical protein